MWNANILYIVHSKKQTRPLVREGARHQEARNCLIVLKIWSEASYRYLTPRQTGRLTVGRNLTLSLSWSSWVPKFQENSSVARSRRIEPREWGYSGVQRSATETRELELGVQKLYNKVWEWELSQLSLRNIHGKLEVEEEVSLWRLSVWLEELVTVRLI
jgi:hypothetical protein